MNIAIVYWTGTGNTKIMAEAIADGIKKADGAVEVFSVDEISVAKLKDYDGFMFGCPAMGCEVLEESEFEPFFTEIENNLQDKPVGLFGSYGWGSGEWMQTWQERTAAAGAKLYTDGLIINYAPDQDGIAKCETFGEGFVKANS